MINKGDIVLINGKKYILGSKLGEGLEGQIFNVENFHDNNYVIKFINDTKLSKLEKDKIYKHLKWLKDLGNTNTKIKQNMALPKALLDDKLGYIMLNAKEHVKLKEYITIDEENFEEWYLKKYTLKKRYQIIVNMFNALREIHLAGLIFTDLSPNNIMVHKKENQIVFIDTDNTRRRTDTYYGVLGTTGYMAPEIHRKIYKDDKDFIKKNNIPLDAISDCGKLSTDSDIFSAAIIAFQLLTLQHPFIGDEIDNGTAEDEEKAFEIKTDYIFKEGTTNTSTFGLTTKFNEITTKKIRELFVRTFVDGKENPYMRPTAEEFVEAFQDALNLIITCPNCGYSRLYTYNTENECVNCKSKIEKKVSAIIYTVFENLDNGEIINNIGDYPKYNIENENLMNKEKNLKSNYIEISRIVLEPNGKEKFLYLRHFEHTIDTSKAYASLTLSTLGRKISARIINKTLFSSPMLIKENDEHTLIPLEAGKSFSLYYSILFNKRKHGKGFINTICKFIME